MKIPDVVPYWRTAHRRNSVRALLFGTVAPILTAVWSALPDSIVRQLPMWVVLIISAAVSAAGLLGAYTKQGGLDG